MDSVSIIDDWGFLCLNFYKDYGELQKRTGVA